VLDPFVQIDDSPRRQHGGAGLGLTIAVRLVALMDGTLAIDSTPGQGSCVTLHLPLVPADDGAMAATSGAAPAPPPTATPPPAPHTRPDPPAPTLAGLRLLLAEDNLTNQRVIRAFLAGSGADLAIVDNGRRAVERLAEDADFDLLLFDIAMPEMDGPAALRRIRSRAGPAAPPAIAVTANVAPHQLEDYRAAGFVDCLAKPLRRAQLLQAVARHARPRARPGAASGERSGWDASATEAGLAAAAAGPSAPDPAAPAGGRPRAAAGYGTQRDPDHRPERISDAVRVRSPEYGPEYGKARTR